MSVEADCDTASKILVSLADRARDARQRQPTLHHNRRALIGHRDDAPTWVQPAHPIQEGGDLLDAGIAYRSIIELAQEAADWHRQLNRALKLRGNGEVAKAAYLDPRLIGPFAAIRGLDRIAPPPTESAGGGSAIPQDKL